MGAVAPMSDPSTEQVAKYLQDIEISALDIWNDLDVLSTHTRIEGVEVPVEGIVIGPDNRFSAVLNLYVSLQYGKDNSEGFTTSDSFLAKIKGHFEDRRPVIDASSVDTSAFYE